MIQIFHAYLWLNACFLGLSSTLAEETPAWDKHSLEFVSRAREVFQSLSPTYLEPSHLASRKTCRCEWWCGGSVGPEAGLECVWAAYPHRPPSQHHGKRQLSRKPGRGLHRPSLRGWPRPSSCPFLCHKKQQLQSRCYLRKWYDVLLNVTDLNTHRL